MNLKQRVESKAKKADGKPKRKRKAIFHREDPPGLLERVARAAKRLQMSRQAFINMCLDEATKDESK